MHYAALFRASHGMQRWYNNMAIARIHNCYLFVIFLSLPSAESTRPTFKRYPTHIRCIVPRIILQFAISHIAAKIRDALLHKNECLVFRFELSGQLSMQNLNKQLFSRQYQRE